MTNRNRNWIVLLVCLFALTACASAENDNAAPQQPEQGAPLAAEYETPDYQFEPSLAAEKHFYAGDDAELELARYDYTLDTLRVSNLEELSPEDEEAAERNVEAFNARMSTLLDEFVDRGSSMGSDAMTLYAQESIDFSAGGFYDETSSSCCRTGDVISVRLESGSYTGGAHGNYYTSSYLFDLRTGQFLDAAHLAEDPEAFRIGAAELLKEKADAIEEKRSDYWPDYADILSRWNEGTVLFNEEGMVVVYSPYDLGPYSMGAVELTVSYDELADLMGPKGLERLGVRAGEDS